MKIQIITEREFSEADYWLWADATIKACKRADPNSTLNFHSFAKLLKDKQFSFSGDLGYTKVITTYKIVE